MPRYVSPRARPALLALLPALLLVAAPAAAQQILLNWPVDCRYGETCFIQNYVDHDPGPGRVDYACGRLSYDGHDGTDIRLLNYPAIEDRVHVLAAAEGIVLRTRDSVRDVNVNEIGPAAVEGIEAGNGVLIGHGSGWQTQYSHLRQGSITVMPGERVQPGDRLGQIGLSGMTEFPHVEFTVRYRGEPVDPFVGLTDFAGCEDAREPLWAPAVAALLPYQETGLLSSGFATGAVDAEAARQGRHDQPALSAEGEGLVFWVDLFGAMAGDVERVVITAPNGQVVHETTRTLEASNVSWFSFSGRLTPSGGWPEGTYSASYTLSRDGSPVVEASGLVVLQRR
ncbi:MAG: peptidoglycan DD-metalloendopeptidase family protein [Alphaproteobacteria bacterium]|jgi:hypothetical protein|nr:peptidoglycan DD-metalloendopeptidase family protein [Alphaproteobacteria bacterium]